MGTYGHNFFSEGKDQGRGSNRKPWNLLLAKVDSCCLTYDRDLVGGLRRGGSIPASISFWNPVKT